VDTIHTTVHRFCGENICLKKCKGASFSMGIF
jgi:hypothetical protein